MKRHFVIYLLTLFLMIVFVIAPTFINKERNLKNRVTDSPDNLKTSVLLDTRSAIEKYYADNGRLPQNLSERLYYSVGGVGIDKARAQIEYKILDAAKYQLCTDFVYARSKSVGDTNYTIEGNSVYHPKGHYCYELDASQYAKIQARNEERLFETLEKKGKLFNVGKDKEAYVALGFNNALQPPSTLLDSFFTKEGTNEGIPIPPNRIGFALSLVFVEPVTFSKITSLFSGCDIQKCGSLLIEGNYDDGTKLPYFSPVRVGLLSDIEASASVSLEKKVKYLHLILSIESQANPRGSMRWQKLIID